MKTSQLLFLITIFSIVWPDKARSQSDQKNIFVSKETVREAIKNADKTRGELGVGISKRRADFINNVRHYNILESERLLSEIIDFYNNQPKNYDPSRWIVTKMNVNEDSSDLILSILEKYTNSEDIRVNETIGLGMLHVIKSNYMEAANESERNRFLAVVENLLARSPSEIHPFTLTWANKSQSYISELPTVEEIQHNQKPKIEENINVKIETKKPSDDKKSAQIESSENEYSKEGIETKDDKGNERFLWLLGVFMLLIALGIILRSRKSSES